MEKFLLCLFLFAAMGALQMRPSQAMDHIIGGSFGWSVPQNASFYQDWAKHRTFGLGDKLVFMYRTGVHNIIQVNKEEFEACTMNKPITMLYKGPTIVELTELGDRFYYDGVGTHCESGQKLGITVTNGPGSSGMFDEAGSPAESPAKTSGAAAMGGSIRNFVVGGGLLCLLISWLI